MSFLPSAMATATMLYVITSIEPSLALENHDRLLGILGINKVQFLPVTSYSNLDSIFNLTHQTNRTKYEIAVR